jgi:alpha-L-fucosidase
MCYRRILPAPTRPLLAAASILLLPRLDGQIPPAAVDYATVQVISPQDSPAIVVEKAARVLPRPNQVAWMRLERTFFLHYGPNSFRGVEWGHGREDPSVFNPTALDARQ